MRVEIRSIKNIKKLEFDVPSPGVHLLTGRNGIGKSTLMICLSRIGNGYAFAENFKTTSDRFDVFPGEIIFHPNNRESVSYAHGGVRWTPVPKKHAQEILGKFGFGNNAYFFPANDPMRLYQQQSELDTQDIRAASHELRQNMTAIFEDDRFNELRYVRIQFKEGSRRHMRRDNLAYLLPVPGGGKQKNYYTEKNFSLGELLTLNILTQLDDIRDGGLVMVDEVEIALYPKVLLNLYRHLERVAREKKLTVLISTHSPSLIKVAKSIYYLVKNPDTKEVQCHYPSTPAMALEGIGIVEDQQPDMVVITEDQMGRQVLDQMIRVFWVKEGITQVPTIKYMPGGGKNDVVKLLDHLSQYLFHKGIRLQAFLDKDVEAEHEALHTKSNRKPKQEIIKQLLDKYNDFIQYLPITPELGLMEVIDTNPDKIEIELKKLHQGCQFSLRQLAQECQGTSNKPRERAKER